MTAPNHLEIRMYRVGFGDCALLSFHYSDSIKNVLIDFGTSSRFDEHKKIRGFQTLLAKDIRTRCNGNPLAVVATHRHTDHISGFATGADGGGPGDIIRSMRPEIVLQPWTEHPRVAPHATDAREDTVLHGLASGTLASDAYQAFSKSQTSMDFIANAAAAYAESHRQVAGTSSLGFLGQLNITNRSAVENLMTMGDQAVYASAGNRSGLEDFLPGVKTHVLGPPTLDQWEAIENPHEGKHPEYWNFAARAIAGRQAGGWEFEDIPFESAPCYETNARPVPTRWLIQKMKQLRSDELLRIVRDLDDELNNTSLVLLFEVGPHTLLFSGDAQLEIWQFIHKTYGRDGLLEDVNLYKVGHHGSLNATPKTLLWGQFRNRSEEAKAGRLATLLSTKSGKHGNVEKETEVPRKPLVDALEQFSDCYDTEKQEDKLRMYTDFGVNLRAGKFTLERLD